MLKDAINNMKEKLKSLSISRSTENKIRRIVELTTLGSGILLIVVSGVKILVFAGSFLDNAIGFTCGLIAINVAYRGIIEDLPRVGALVNKRNFWG
jgi:hypothetical protein